MLEIFLAGGGTAPIPDLDAQTTVWSLSQWLGGGSLSEWLVALGTIGLAVVAGWPYLRDIFQQTTINLIGKIYLVREMRGDDLAGQGKTNKLNLVFQFYNPQAHSYWQLQSLAVSIEDKNHNEIAKMQQLLHFDEVAPEAHKGQLWAAPIYVAPQQVLRQGVQFISEKDLVLEEGGYTIKLYKDNSNIPFGKATVSITKKIIKKLYENRGPDVRLVELDADISHGL